ncbi:hypothetical protein OUZ56_032361 [Daphnia magna]|uniref:Uncharacterized protein n=1 Tax=Daphnia magna TaxID=35525 RepID=A0ABR0B953_9CRUS|nr:hypothetical protein OUZ56_032361 [Daphnia magna]
MDENFLGGEAFDHQRELGRQRGGPGERFVRQLEIGRDPLGVGLHVGRVALGDGAEEGVEERRRLEEGDEKAVPFRVADPFSDERFPKKCALMGVFEDRIGDAQHEQPFAVAVATGRVARERAKAGEGALHAVGVDGGVVPHFGAGRFGKHVLKGGDGDAGVTKSRVYVGREHFRDHLNDRVGDVGHPGRFAKRRNRGKQALVQRFLAEFAERDVPGHEFVEHDRRRIQIGARFGDASELFRRHVGWRPEGDAGLREVLVRRKFRFGDAKIEDFDDPRLGLDGDVGRL